MSGTGVICQDCPYQDIWHPGRTVRDKCKHDLVHEDHTVDYVDPGEVSKLVRMDGELVTRLDEQSNLVADDGGCNARSVYTGTERSGGDD